MQKNHFKKTLNKSMNAAAIGVALFGSVPAFSQQAVRPIPDPGSFYIQAQLGYTRNDLDSIIGRSPYPSITLSYRNGAGGFVWGGGAGFQINHWAAVEAGGFNFPNVKQTMNPLVSYIPKTDFDYKTYGLYLAGRFSHPIASKWAFSTKAGLGYQCIKTTNFDLSDGHGFKNASALVPFFGAGVSRGISQSLALSLEWSHFGDYIRHTKDQYIVAQNLFTAGLNYSFSI